MRNPYPSQMLWETSCTASLDLTNLVCVGRKVVKWVLKTVSCTLWCPGITSHSSPLVLTRARSWDYMLGQVGQSLSVDWNHQLGVLGSNQRLKTRGIEVVMGFWRDKRTSCSPTIARTREVLMRNQYPSQILWKTSSTVSLDLTNVVCVGRNLQK